MNAFFKKTMQQEVYMENPKWRNKEWNTLFLLEIQTWLRKYEIDFILTENPEIVKDVTALSKLKSSDHRIVNGKVGICLRKERKSLINKRQPNTIAVKEKTDEFIIKIQNVFSVLSDEMEDDMEEAHNRLTKVVIKVML